MDEEEEPVFVDFGLCAFNSQFPDLAEKNDEFPEDAEIAPIIDVSGPFDFETVPLALRCNIISRFDYSTYANLVKCSKHSRRTCDQLSKQRYRHEPYCLNVTEKRMFTEEYSYGREKYIRKYWQRYQRSRAKLYLHHIEIQCPLTKERCRKIIGLFRQNQTTCDFLVCQRITCEPEMLQDLIELLKCSEFHIEETAYAKNEILQLPSVRKLNAVDFRNCSATDRDLIGLTGSYITLHSDGVTSKGIAKFIQQWSLGKRNVESVVLQFDTTSGTRAGDDMVRGTDATLLWSPETHKDSHLGAFPLESFQGVSVTYSIKRMTPNSEEPETLLLKVNDENVHLCPEHDFHSLRFQINREVYYDTKRECRFCEAEFCEHYNRFSFGRFRRAFPLISKSIAFSAVIGKFSIYPLQVFHLPTTFNVAYLRTVSRPYFYIE